MQFPEYFESDLLFFFADKPAELALCRALIRQLESAFPDASARVQKSQVSFYGNGLFAMVSLPRRKRDSGIVVSFGLGYRLTSPRIAMAVEPYPGRWTHHVPVTGPEQLDGELLNWLREAWCFSQTKRRRAP